MPGGNIESSNKEWLLNGKIDKPVYLVLKSGSGGLLDKYHEFRFIRQEGGFLIYCRQPDSAK
jgi:hypothetical protein